MSCIDGCIWCLGWIQFMLTYVFGYLNVLVMCIYTPKLQEFITQYCIQAVSCINYGGGMVHNYYADHFQSPYKRAYCACENLDCCMLRSISSYHSWRRNKIFFWILSSWRWKSRMTRYIAVIIFIASIFVLCKAQYQPSGSCEVCTFNFTWSNYECSLFPYIVQSELCVSVLLNSAKFWRRPAASSHCVSCCSFSLWFRYSN